MCFTILLAVAALAAPVKAAVLTSSPKLNPPLKDVKSDKKFFGPPFPADYPEDKRPVVQKNILDKLKGPEQPYPALQSKADFDSDYVKDENSDKGAWQAQFEYDSLRKKLAQEEADEKRAQDRADREGHDVDDAQRADDEAGKKVSDAEKAAADAGKEEEKAKTAEDFGGPPTDEKLKELKKAVAAAEDKLAKQEKSFEECKRQLEQAKKELDDLKAAQADMQKKLDSETKLWAEKKAKVEADNALSFNLRKAKQDEAAKTKLEKVKTAQDKLAAAEKVKAGLEKALAKEKAEHDKAIKNVQTQKTQVETVKKQIADAAGRLSKLHGYKPAKSEAAPAKSSSWFGWAR